MRGGNRVGSRPVDIQRVSESVVVRVENTQPRRLASLAKSCSYAELPHLQHNGGKRWWVSSMERVDIGME
jgi:hypothetical protein